MKNIFTYNILDFKVEITFGGGEGKILSHTITPLDWKEPYTGKKSCINCMKIGTPDCDYPNLRGAAYCYLFRGVS